LKKLKSLNNYSVKEVKKEISKQLGYDVSKIRLFGSRIIGGYTKNSDLDIAVLDEKKCLDEIEPFYINVFKMKGEIHYVDSFDTSILKLISA